MKNFQASERMDGIDATFLYSETATTFMHTLKVLVVEPLDRLDGPRRLAHLHRELESRLHLLPRFTRRVVATPLGLHHPLWVEDPAFELQQHLHYRRAAAPGSAEDLDAVVAEIAETPLERHRPLWEVWIIDGLAGDRVAYVTKLHHAVADGVASAAMLAAVMGRPPGEIKRLRRLGRLPTSKYLVGAAVRDQVARFRKLPGLLLATVRAGGRVRRRVQALPHLPRPFSSERTRFNRTLSSGRTFATTSLSLAAVKEVKDAFGVSLNDVLLLIVGEAVRRFLDSVGETPRKSLLASVPVGEGSSDRLTGNRVSHLITTLATSGDDLGQRLARIHRGSLSAKAAYDALGPGVMRRWAEFTPPGPYNWGYRAYAGLSLANVLTPPTNLIVSNVKGPKSGAHIGGARLVELYSVGPLLEGLGLNVTAWSCGDRLGCAFLADRAVLPDASALARRLTQALDDARSQAARR